MPDCYYVIAVSDDASAAEAPSRGKPLDEVCADAAECATKHDGTLDDCKPKNRGTAEVVIGYPTKPEARANLAPIEACLARKGNDVIESKVRD